MNKVCDTMKYTIIGKLIIKVEYICYNGKLDFTIKYKRNVIPNVAELILTRTFSRVI